MSKGLKMVEELRSRQKTIDGDQGYDSRICPVFKSCDGYLWCDIKLGSFLIDMAKEQTVSAIKLLPSFYSRNKLVGFVKVHIIFDEMVEIIAGG